MSARATAPSPQAPTQRERLNQHPLIAGLFEELPPAGAPFPDTKRSDWLEAANVIFKLVYGKDNVPDRQSNGRQDVEQ